MSIPTVMGEEVFELVDEKGLPITTHFTSFKTLDNAINIILKFDPDRKLKVRRMTLVWDCDYYAELWKKSA